MTVFIIRHLADGRVEEVTRTLEGAGRVLHGHGEGSFADGSPFHVGTIHAKMEVNASIQVIYTDGDVLILEKHFVAS